MYDGTSLIIAKSFENNEPVSLPLSMANRHGIIAGATGTGKTVTLKTMAQSMSDAGIPVFLADIKGDVSGVAIAGEESDKLKERLAKIGVEGLDFHACPTRFWDVYGEGGTPVRTTITEMGPVLLARLLDLTEVQEGVLNIAFHVADDQGLLLLDLKDLRSMIAYLGEHAADFNTTYGAITKQSVGAIQRSLLQLEDAGGAVFFGEPALDINDWLACDEDGRGYVNILDCVKLVQSPLLYSTFLLWMLSELYELLPEAGDVEKPKICFFFDEAHLLFNDAPAALLDKVEQIVKLIRSKGVGVYFISQTPSDIPDSVLAQLGNRVQHALRAYTPAEQKSIKAAAQSFRENPAFDTETAITELGTGQALVSFLDEDGKPGIVQQANVIAPGCSMAAAPAEDRQYIMQNCPLLPKYRDPVDRESAYEMLTQKAQAAAVAEEEAKAAAAQAAEEEKARKAAEKEAARLEAQMQKQREREEREAEKAYARAQQQAQKQAEKEAAARAKIVNDLTNNAIKQVGNQLIRGLFGGLRR